MKKRIISFVLAFVLVFSLIVHVAAQEQPSTNNLTVTESQKISDELLEKIGTTYNNLSLEKVTSAEETYSCIIWIEDISMETAVKAGIDAAEMTRDTYTASTTYDYPYTVMEVNGVEVVEVELAEDENAEYVDAYIAAERATAANMYQEKNTSFVENFLDTYTVMEGSIERGENEPSNNKTASNPCEVNYISSYSPCIFADLTVEKIAELSQNDQVQRIGYWDTSKPTNDEIGNAYEGDDSSATLLDSDELDDLNEHIQIIKADVARTAYNVSGAGIKIGQYELDYPNSTNVTKKMTNGPTSNHATNVYTIMHTVAPSATYYAVDDNIRFQESIEWLITCGVNIINISCGWNDKLNEYDDRSRWVDHIAYNHDVHIVKSAGNWGNSGVTSPGMAYNIITVGNTEMTSAPYQRYSSSSYNTNGANRVNMRTYKPDIAAPGCYASSNRKGTSYAAPLVTGTLALMCHGQPSLKTRQFVAKAILAASTGMESGRYVPGDSKFVELGAGVVDASVAMWLIYTGQYSSLTGSVSSSSPTQTYNMQVTSSDTSMRIALAYSHRISFSGTDHSILAPEPGVIAEVRLEIYDPNWNLIQSCITSGANLKVVQFDPRPYGTGTYYIVVRQTQANGNNTTTNFGVAWR